MRVLEKLVWAAGHLVHMPGHVYYRLGEYGKARRSFIASMRVDSTYMADQQVPVSRVWNYVHNLNYLLANCAEEGRYREGLEWARRLEEVPLVPRRPFFFYQGRMALPRLHMRFGSWSRAALGTGGDCRKRHREGYVCGGVRARHGGILPRDGPPRRGRRRRCRGAAQAVSRAGSPGIERRE